MGCADILRRAEHGRRSPSLRLKRRLGQVSWLGDLHPDKFGTALGLL